MTMSICFSNFELAQWTLLRGIMHHHGCLYKMPDVAVGF